MTTIKTSREIDAVFRDGTRSSHPLIMAIGMSSPARAPERGRVAFVAGRKTGNAVARNRAKRLLREATRRLGGPWTGWDVVLIARARTASCGEADVEVALREVLGKLGVST